MIFTNSESLVKRALKVFPGGANTLSKYPGRRYGYPIIYKGQGCYLLDIDANSYIDWTAGLGAVILGYEQFKENKIFTPLYTSVTEEEILLAEKLVEIIPCAEQVRFFKTGSECTLAAIRLARAVTGREEIIYSGYHGWHDWYAYNTDKSKGSIYTYAEEFEYGIENIDKLERIIVTYNPACIIMEPVNRTCPEKASKEYLQEVRNLCTKNNVLLIFDEIISGFRYDIGGISTLWNIEPDLACYSKAMANGWPISALVGKEKYMKEMKDLMISGTFNGEILSCQYALRNIEFIQKNNVIKNINDKAEYMINKLLIMIQGLHFIQIKYFKSKFDFIWSNQEKRKVFHDYVLENGVYTNDNHFMMSAHRQEDIEKTLEVYQKGFQLIKE